MRFALQVLFLSLLATVATASAIPPEHKHARRGDSVASLALSRAKALAAAWSSNDLRIEARDEGSIADLAVKRAKALAGRFSSNDLASNWRGRATKIPLLPARSQRAQKLAEKYSENDLQPEAKARMQRRRRSHP
ncbi:hypothetical protein DFP72DRAFT_1076799 [Ephemerocybe angulata]|uniref:Uncharacterized protein n=1 Tax=Ephemerocybe angulata TaxID=980116 RepID=A0A8H6HGQ4_9AGAR|nr:hypothetical protein DFP72DRAFT_1076799 [Tulosesus angulatus]